MKQKGFTLIEVLMAVGILAILASIIHSTWSGNIVRYKTSKIKIEAVELLQKKIIEIETEFKNNVDSLPKEKQTGEFEEDKYKNYTWEWETQEINLPDISALMDTENQEPLVVSVLENFRKFLNESIKEVKISVTYKQGKQKPYVFTVPIYLVNFDNEISMGAGLPQSTQPPGTNTNPTGGGF